MIARWHWLLLGLLRKLWLRAAFFALLGVATALLSIAAEWIIPWDLPAKIGADAVDQILNILASSMLAVTTFSLTVMMTAYSAATSNVTPRATQILRQDQTTQNVLATFLGSFLYSLVGIIALNTDLYGERGRAMLFLVTLGVILIIVVTLLRWIEHLASLGRVDETSRRIEEAAQAAIVTRAKDPCMGGRPLPDGDHAIPASAVPFCSAITGYVQHVDMQMLARLADEEKADIYLSGLPGLLVHPARTLVWIDGKDVGGEKVEKIAASVCDAFAIGDQRTFDEDPRFGLVVLTEIASRALSPGINDPGTAIDVIGRLLRLLITWKSEQAEEAADPHWPRIWVPPLQLKDMFDDAFMPIARDGAPMVEVELRLLKSLLALSRLDDDYAASAVRLARVALLHAESKLGLEQEKSRLRAVVAEIEASA